MNFFFIKTVLSIKIYHQSIKIKKYNGIINSINYRGSFWINLSKESSIDPLLLLFLIPSDTHLISIRSLTILTSERILLEMKNCPMFLLTIFFVFFHIPRYSEETRYFLSIIAIHRLPWGCVFLQFFIISFVNNYFLLFLDILLVRISMNYCFLLEMCSIVIDLEL